MSLDHDAIRKAYPDASMIDDDLGAFKEDGTKITLVQSAIDTARTELNTAATAVKYKEDRREAYPSISDQLDMQYWDKVNGTSTWQDAIAKVKSDNPKE
jgi:hypothetical protein